MTFKVTDLMIELSQPGAACHPTFVCACTHITHVTCGFCSFAHTICHLGCSLAQPSFCQHGSITVTITCPGTLVTDTSPIIQTLPQVNGAALGNLKNQLKEALAAAEKQEATEANALQVQTVADAELLEKKLGEALEEVRARKAQLKK